MTKMLLICLVAALWPLLLLCGCQNPAGRMSLGEIMYRGKCASCHNLIAPGQFGPDEWKKYVERYGKKLTPEEKHIILDYLILAPPDETSRENRAIWRSVENQGRMYYCDEGRSLGAHDKMKTPPLSFPRKRESREPKACEASFCQCPLAGCCIVYV